MFLGMWIEDTLNTSLYMLDGADRSGMCYDITFISIDVTVSILDANGTIHYKHLFEQRI